MNPDFATSRWSQWKGCGRNLKMVPIPCCVSITMVTCLSQTPREWGWKRERDVVRYHFTVNYFKTWHTRKNYLAKIDWHVLLSQLGSWVPPEFLCSPLAPIVWWDSRWGCRSVTLQLQDPCQLIQSLPCPCWLRIYGLVNEHGAESRPKSQVFCQKGPKFASLQLILWRHDEANSIHLHTTRRESGLFSRETIAYMAFP